MFIRRIVLWPIALACGMLLASVMGAIVVHDAAMGAASTSNKSGSIEVDGRKRTYFVHLPPGYDGRTPLPLVLVLHGATESPEGVERLSRMSIKVDEANFIAVYPRGTGRLNPAHFPTWNSGACCGYAMTHHVDDVGFLRALIAKLKKDYAVDPKRIYVTGISNGGMMSYRLACELSGEIAAAAPVEGAQDIPCHPSNPVSIIVFHGTADHLVPFNGGSTPFQMGSKRSDTPVRETVAFWVKEDGCSAVPKHSETSEARTDVYTGCRQGSGVALYAIQGRHHMWPGVRMSGNSVPATDLMWAFFAAHPKP